MTTLNPAGAPASAILVKLAARPDFATIASLPRGAERKTAAYQAIVETARTSQAPILALAEQLKTNGAITGYETLVSPNMLVVSPAPGKASAVSAAFQAAAGVKALYSNDNGARLGAGKNPLHVATPGPARGFDVLDQPLVPVAPPTDRPYGLDLIGAPEANERGADGHGLVYGSIDTGADVNHEALASAYRGRQTDGSINDDYNFYDPSGRTSKAHDSGSHGTHTIGTVVGAGVGAAPQAKFIAAIGLSGHVDSTLKSLQWMLAPTKSDGTAPDPTQAPDVVGMSWWTGKSNEDLFHESMQDLRAAGIYPVKSAGNAGPGTGTITSPGQYPELISMAAVDAHGAVARFSSRGPAPFPAGSSTPKPDFAGPGVDVISSVPGNRYAKMSGTSMAQPHGSAAILDILSLYPQLTDEQLVQVLAAGALDKGAPGVDSEYGAGLINLPASLDAAAKLVGAPQLTTVAS